MFPWLQLLGNQDCQAGLEENCLVAIPPKLADELFCVWMDGFCNPSGGGFGR
jgi:hypothetical protein